MSIKNEIVNAIREDNLYDYICGNFHNMSEEEQRRLALELWCCVKKESYEELINNIEYYMYDDDEVRYI